MLTENFVSVIMQVSITGAGLILAVYALVAPLSRRIFEERVVILNRKMQEFEEVRSQISPESSEKEIQKLEKLRKEIKEVRIFPRYLGIGVAATFLLYMVSLLGASGWLVNPTYRTPENETPILFSFAISNALFMIVGLLTLFEVFSVMKKEFEEIKRKQKEIGKIKGI